MVLIISKMNLSHNEDYHKLAINEKVNFLSFVFNLGEAGLKRLFKFPGENFSLWWFSSIAVKSPFRSDYYERLISHLSVGSGTDPSNSNNRKNRSIFFYFFRGIYYLCYYFARLIKIKGMLKDFKRRKSCLGSMDYIIVSYFPLIDKVKSENSIFENMYLAPFHRILDEKRKDNYAHICLQSTIDGYSFEDAIKMANQFNKNQKVFFLEEFVKLSHVLLFFFYYFYYILLFVLNIKVIRQKSNYSYNGKSYNTWQILKEDFYDSFCGEHLVTSIWFILLFRELTKSVKQDSKIIAICEMQWWEKALYLFAKKRGIMTIGFQHCIVPELVFNYFNIPQEFSGNNLQESCPLPDYLATVGDTTKQLLIKYGWPKERVFVWGAQRFEELKNLKGSALGWKNRKNYLVCALPMEYLEMCKVLSMLEHAFIKHPGYKIILKSHPVGVNLGQTIEKLGLNFSSETFEMTQEALTEILKYAKAMLVTESSSSLYAVAYGIPVIVPRFINKLDYNPLSYISDIPIYVYSSEELRKISDQVMRSSEPPLVNDDCDNFLKNYFYFPEDEEEYLEKIDGLKYRG